MVELEARPPVGGSQQSLQGTGQVNKHVAHQEEPTQTEIRTQSEQLYLLPRHNHLHSVFRRSRVYIRHVVVLHGEDGGNSVQRGDDDADLTDTGCEE